MFWESCLHVTIFGVGSQVKSVIYLFSFLFYYIKKVLAKGKQKYVIKKIPLVARSSKEDSRRNRSKEWRSS